MSCSHKSHFPPSIWVTSGRLGCTSVTHLSTVLVQSGCPWMFPSLHPRHFPRSHRQNLSRSLFKHSNCRHLCPMHSQRLTTATWICKTSPCLGMKNRTMTEKTVKPKHLPRPTTQHLSPAPCRIQVPTCSTMTTCSDISYKIRYGGTAFLLLPTLPRANYPSLHYLICIKL